MIEQQGRAQPQHPAHPRPAAPRVPEEDLSLWNRPQQQRRPLSVAEEIRNLIQAPRQGLVERPPRHDLNVPRELDDHNQEEYGE
jgi:hypothetical protein